MRGRAEKGKSGEAAREAPSAVPAGLSESGGR
jgi:hypothetical protein